MKPLNPFFKDIPSKEKDLSHKVNVRKKPITKDEGRKVRCDKKKDVKIPFTPDERQLIKELAKKRGLDPTPYCSYLLIKALRSNYEFPEVYYDPKGKPYPAKLDEYFHEELFKLKVKWDCSLKESAYRIVSYMLYKESREM